MKSVIEVQQTIRAHTQPLPSEITALTTSVLGMVLAETIRSDVDSPPFDKSAMDGYAICLADLTSSEVEFEIQGEVAAGDAPGTTLEPGKCVRIFTGAPIPQGADAVIMQEKATRHQNRVRFQESRLFPQMNIIAKGSEMQMDQAILEPGLRMRPQELGLLAGVGRTTVRMFPLPRISIIATGSELVEPMMKPRPGQIRNTNTTMIMAQSVRAGALPRFLGLAKDNAQQLKSLLNEGLQTSDMVILTGGVSVGDHDLVPNTLREMGVELFVEKVQMKPGKPFLYGKKQQTSIFGLPGNPVSSFICFELFVRLALEIQNGKGASGLPVLQLPITTPIHVNSDRPLYLPAKTHLQDGTLQVQPFAWTGSFDLKMLQGANAIIPLMAGESNYLTGQNLDVFVLEMI